MRMGPPRSVPPLLLVICLAISLSPTPAYSHARPSQTTSNTAAPAADSSRAVRILSGTNARSPPRRPPPRRKPPPRRRPPPPSPPPPPAPLVVTGPIGNYNALNAFDDGIKGKLRKIFVHSGAIMDSIQAFYGTYQAPKHGGNGGNPQPVFALQSGEDIIDAAVSTSLDPNWPYLKSISLSTNMGRQVVIGALDFSSDPVEAGPCPVGSYKLVSLRGSSSQYLEALSFVWQHIPGKSTKCPPHPPSPPLPPPSPPPPPPPPLSSIPLVTGPFGFYDPFNGFDDGMNGNLTEISVRSGAIMDAIQVTYGTYQAPMHGGWGGAPNPVFILDQGECIIDASIVVDPYWYEVKSISLTTNMGRNVSLGAFDPSDGQIPAGPCPVGSYELVSIQGASSQYVDALSFVWMYIPGTPDPATASC